MRLIDADALMADFQKAFPNFDVKSSHAKALLATAPTIRQTAGMCFGCNCPKMEKLEAEPTKHGYWKWNKQYGTECSECGTAMFEVIGHIFSSATPKYCPYCGAKMDDTPTEKVDTPTENTNRPTDEVEDGKTY